MSQLRGREAVPLERSVRPRTITKKGIDVSKNGWLDVKMVKPECKRDPDALGTAVLIWPRNPQDERRPDVDGFAYYGRRATGKPAFYLYGAEIHGVTHGKLQQQQSASRAVKQ